MTRLIDADALKKEFTEGAFTTRGVREIIDNAPTVDVMTFTSIICGDCKFVDVARNRKPCCSCKWLERKSYYEEDGQ